MKPAPSNGQNADEFCVIHPEFLDHEKNCKQFNKVLDVMFGANIAYSLDQFERAYEVCKANNSLELDQVRNREQQQTATTHQRKALTKQRQERERSRNLSEDELGSTAAGRIACAHRA